MTNMRSAIRSPLPWLVGASLAITLPFSAGAQEILFSSFAPPGDLFNTGIIRPWAEDVKRVTEGRVTVKFTDTPLAAPPQQWEMVTKGLADAGYIFNGFTIKRAPLQQIAHIPFLGPSAEAASVALWRTHKQFFEKANEYNDVQLLSLFVGPTGQMYSLTDAPVDGVERFKGLKLWALPGVPARGADILGASVVPGPAVRIHDVVSKGVVDAFMGIALYHADAYNGLQFAKSATLIPGGVSAPGFSVLINKGAWAKLSPKDQELVMSVSGETLARRAKVYDEGEAKAVAKFKAAGGKLMDADAAFVDGLKKAWAPFEAEWLESAAKANVDGKAALAFYREQLAKGAGK